MVGRAPGWTRTCSRRWRSLGLPAALLPARTLPGLVIVPTAALVGSRGAGAGRARRTGRCRSTTFSALAAVLAVVLAEVLAAVLAVVLAEVPAAALAAALAEVLGELLEALLHLTVCIGQDVSV